MFAVFPVFTVLKSIGAVPEPFTPLLRFVGKVTFSHHALSETFKGNFAFFKNNPLSSALPRTVLIALFHQKREDEVYVKPPRNGN